ncbi:hypothetical protein Q5424_22040 [Conexibacter sp. JD483]|uniref:hypothetical protein n=1 Tax=unclassified Conexibacter TaxID=2627773 RepID=UPI00271BDF08|nr:MULTISPECIES: hypothetical protein [unclassified Conexibacter]MDO8186166.1 hypothetical protein [Conexibacter sp. CPCC 205706]MDO8199656.1 hypothetical protein [Conexibacter sp. CPCC 205762]MDR9371794.1 hypothetical protein [Conexibacter sp. JD483]
MSETPTDHHPLPLDPEETVDAVPVVDEVRALERVRPRQLPAVRAAAVAATGFVAGAATVVAISHRARKRGGLKLGGRRRGKGADALPIVATRSVLLDIHLLGREQ